MLGTISLAELSSEFSLELSVSLAFDSIAVVLVGLVVTCGST